MSLYGKFQVLSTVGLESRMLIQGFVVYLNLVLHPPAHLPP